VATNMAGRGTDIKLGGDPEQLAEASLAQRGLNPEETPEEFRAALPEALAQAKRKVSAEEDEVRDLGGLYVLGTERHESRRIDNQLRGRSGRQGDPGESRFYLSLEDDLMRIFATGAMNWVMGKALPDDVPIEARMVTRAIERAQHTVEERNAEIRKDVLKYDEVMNEQRKVIYARRMQVIDGEDLRQRTLDLLADLTEATVRDHCPDDFEENWDLDGLLNEVRLLFPTRFSADDLRQAASADQVFESVLTEAVARYEEREQGMPGGAETMRQLERDIMLQIIDQRWREHLAEMDYLREGINLRAMGQQDPLVAWQKEGYDMFGQLMDAINEDYVRYVMHVEVLAEQPSEPDLGQASYVAQDDPVQGTATIPPAQPAVPGPPAQPSDAPGMDMGLPGGAVPGADELPPQAPVVKADKDKLGRNQPCWCGSGKKYKLCHGR